jgi:hypothetical protein
MRVNVRITSIMFRFRLSIRLYVYELLNDDIVNSTLPSAPLSHHSSSQRADSLGFNGVTYKQFYFATPKDVEVWMKVNLAHPLHGLFVDLVSLVESTSQNVK